ncbi:1-acyl-sn-glycerol-3-phosphate acyltransferase [Sedimentibacter sp. zth1]|uniref:lysophospholipid acyltransferase family protein n=1 Tax=Sedimentibacter sp. zth1 TaxID=2816908 RepID=UPI001A90F46B|nr:lysophospholipid acyltransferase family protein [Sedimentibacter sp. zth1]QSX06786.1 1-acyl-sn-glycerol-3-phosphate acyltransferase [Sedimentibacter sp. zth1]
MLVKFLKGLVKVVLFPFFRVKLYNVENFNKSTGKCIVCSNHISNFDPVMLMIYTKRHINFMAKKELFDVFFIKNVLKYIGAFPVDRDKPSLSTIKGALSILKNGEVLGIFPEGTRVNEYNEENAKSGIALIANKGDANIIPIFIKSSYKIFSKVEIFFGKPKKYFQNFEGKVTSAQYREVSKEMLRDIYSLEKEVN